MNSYNELRKRLTTSGYPWNLVKPGVHERWELPNGSVFILARGASSNGHARQNYLKQIERAERAYTESLSGMAVNSPAPVPLPMVFEEVEPTPMSVVKVPAGPMPEPFSCRIGDEDVNAVNARGLHAALGVGRDFSNWIKDQITRARLVEHRDFERLAENGEQCFQGVTSRIEYALSLDAAKHVAMMAGTDKGFEVRDYFIKCEKKLSHVINTYLNETSNRLPDRLAVPYRRHRPPQPTTSICRIEPALEKLWPRAFKNSSSTTSPLRRSSTICMTSGTAWTR